MKHKVNTILSIQNQVQSCSNKEKLGRKQKKISGQKFQFINKMINFQLVKIALQHFQL